MTDNRKTKFSISNLVAYVTLVLACILVLFPFLVIIVTSLKTYPDSVKVTFEFFPETVTTEAYSQVLKMSSLWRGLGNTIIIVVPIMFIGVFNSSLAAYSFAKIKFKGRGLAFTILMFSMMLPGVITMTPAYVIYDTLGWTDTFLPLMIPNAFGTVTCMFYLRQYFHTIPKEMLEAAEIDGLGRFGTFLRIILPLSKPALVAQLILWLIAGYNDYFGPMLYLDSERKYTLQLVLHLMTGSAQSNWPKIMAGCVVALIPMLVIYLVAQKSFIDGIVSTGGLKE